MRLKVGSLFTGIGGFDLGFEQMNFQTCWMCEIDKHANRLLKERFDCDVFGDVRKLDSAQLTPVDVVVFGSPCQDLSRGGKGAGLAGERSGLFHEAIRIVHELRQGDGKPRLVVWENVPGALTSNDGEDFACVLQAFLNIGATDVAWRVLDSQAFGVPQRRRRLFLVADFGGERAAEVLGISESGEGDSAPPRGQANLAVAPADGRAAGDGRWWDGRDVSDTLDVSMLTKGQMLPEKRRFPCVFVPDDGWRKVVYAADCDEDGTCPACGDQFSHCGCPGPTMDGFDYEERSDGMWSRPSGWQPGDERLRRLTPLECERLQGFPDGWTEGQSDIQRYKQLGNAVTVNVAEWIAFRIDKELKDGIA